MTFGRSVATTSQPSEARVSLDVYQESRGSLRQRDIARRETNSRTQLNRFTRTHLEGRKVRGYNLATQPESCSIRHAVI